MTRELSKSYDFMNITLPSLNDDEKDALARRLESHNSANPGVDPLTEELFLARILARQLAEWAAADIRASGAGLTAASSALPREKRLELIGIVSQFIQTNKPQ